MKRIIGIGLILILLIVGISFFINNPINIENEIDLSKQSIDYSENGISLSMPGDWVSANSYSNDTVLAVADSNVKDSSGFNTINVNIEKKSKARSLQSEFNSNYNTLARNSDYNILYLGNVSFNGEEAMEADYTSMSTSGVKQHKAIWIKKGSDIYVILCSAPISEYENELGTFDFIINSVKFS